MGRAPTGLESSRFECRRNATATVHNRGKAYTYTDGMGLGWMVSSDGLLHHAGGGPGVFFSPVCLSPKERAAAILTNAEHGLGLINEIMAPWLEELGTIRPFGMADIEAPRTAVRVDPEPYVGVYEDIANRYDVMRTPTALRSPSRPNSPTTRTFQHSGPRLFP